MTGRRPVFVCVRLILLILVLFHGIVEARKMKCEDLTIPMCKNLGYNVTYMPNRFNHENQKEAALEVHQFWPLVQIHCSPVLNFFLCSLYAPVCDKTYGKELLPCRSVCEQAKLGCLKLMQQHGFAWPEKMECDKWPSKTDGKLCMAPDKSLPNVTPTNLPSEDIFPGKPPFWSLTSVRPGMTNPSGGPFDTAVPSSTVSSRTCQCSCQKPFVTTDPTWERNIAGMNNCALPCNSSYFSPGQKKFAATWITLWSTLCFVSTLLTLATYFLNTARFSYPERPVIFLSGCYLLLSFGYILRMIAGESAVICDKHDLIASETTGPAVCTLVFLLTYFGGMASALWWVILAFTWFLSAGMKWSKEAISNVSQYFHVVAWLIPSVQTIAVLAMSSIDGDPLSGICYVGNQNKDSLIVFVIIPLGIYLTVGTTFLVAGFVSLFHIRKVMRHDGTSTNKLERLMVRIGVFSVLYTVPATVTIGCYFYEMTNRENWERSYACQNCWHEGKVTKPEFSAFMVKYFMSLIVGVSTGFWICSMKTVDSWQDLAQRCFRRKKRPCKNSLNELRETTALQLTVNNV